MSGRKRIDLREYSDQIIINLPDGENCLEENISTILEVDPDLPADVTSKMAKTPSLYARYGVVRAEMEEYLENLKDKYSEFDRQARTNARNDLPDKATESRIAEKAYLDNSDKIKKYKLKIHRVEAEIEKLKRVMNALEMQAEMLRSISARVRREEEQSKMDDSIPSGRTSSLGEKKKK